MPQLPKEDLELIERNEKWVNTCKRFAPDYHSRDDSYPETKHVETQLLFIISRQQLAMAKLVEQRDEEMQYNPMSKSTKEAWKDRKNNQIKEILAGFTRP